jgi:hypothetical protein
MLLTSSICRLQELLNALRRNAKHFGTRHVG